MNTTTLVALAATAATGVLVVKVRNLKKKIAQDDRDINILLDAVLNNDEAAIDYAGYAIPRR